MHMHMRMCMHMHMLSIQPRGMSSVCAHRVSKRAHHGKAARQLLRALGIPAHDHARRACRGERDNGARQCGSMLGPHAHALPEGGGVPACARLGREERLAAGEAQRGVRGVEERGAWMV